MRDAQRIRPLMAQLTELWEEHPDQRFGQLLMNLSRDSTAAFRDVWEWDTAEYEQAIRQFRMLHGAPGLPDKEKET